MTLIIKGWKNIWRRKGQESRKIDKNEHEKDKEKDKYQKSELNYEGKIKWIAYCHLGWRWCWIWIGYIWCWIWRRWG